MYPCILSIGVTKPKASFQTLTQVHSMEMVDHLPTATSLKLPIFLKVWSSSQGTRDPETDSKKTRAK